MDAGTHSSDALCENGANIHDLKFACALLDMLRLAYCVCYLGWSSSDEARRESGGWGRTTIFSRGSCASIDMLSPDSSPSIDSIISMG